jgi:hypothetical protein
VWKDPTIAMWRNSRTYNEETKSYHPSRFSDPGILNKSCWSKVLKCDGSDVNTHSICFVIAPTSCMWVKICHLGTFLAERLPTGFFSTPHSPSFRRLYHVCSRVENLPCKLSLNGGKRKRLKRLQNPMDIW